jgi:hypothetical protein
VVRKAGLAKLTARLDDYLPLYPAFAVGLLNWLDLDGPDDRLVAFTPEGPCVELCSPKRLRPRCHAGTGCG